jgi:hypothetical protein
VRGDLSTLLTPSSFKPGEVVGKTAGDSSWFELEPRVNDGSLRLSGAMHNGALTGRWVRVSNLPAWGGFRLLPDGGGRVPRQ